ncbi:CopG family antitoxin [Pseudorhodoplanes sp.]|uniref:CopG family antitoxin n=1 Tax=Pseudorhodoplanes sp. TaxID=1934341 RepID=UPI003D0DCD3B
MKKKLPKLRSDKAAENFVATADLTAFDLSGFKPVQFEFAPKAARVNMRLSTDLLKAIKSKAAKQGVPYQRFIRQALEKAVAAKRAS